MTGYLNPHLKNASKEAKKEYRTFYCSLCHTLKHNFGISGICNLSYELTFFLILLYSLNEGKEPTFNGCCSVTPFLNVKYIDYFSDEFIVASEISMLISKYEADDDVIDGNKIFSRIKANILSRKVHSIEKKAFINDISDALHIFYSCEKSEEVSFNQVLNAAGDVVESFIKPLTDTLSVNDTIIFNDISNNIGKWIYLIDALDDYDKDLSNGEFNPFTLDDFIKPNVILNELEQTIKISISRLSVKHYKELIKHIVNYAIPKSRNDVLTKTTINIDLLK